jgi:oligopeptide/dipeptide ABC transporter ATP-binding protein
VLNRGEIVEDGPASQVFTAPAHPYTQRLIASAPSLTKPRIAQRHRKDQ